MIDSEDKPIAENLEASSSADAEQSSTAAPFSEPEKEVHAPVDAHDVGGDDGQKDGKGTITLGELFAVGIKAIAVTLSVVFLLLSILTVAMPLSAMRTFNRLGWDERALNSGDKYISRRIRQGNAGETDALGNYTRFAAAKLNDADMIEAYDVCIGLSRKLMNKSASDGDGASAEYFARKLERYTRQYMSLGNIMAINRDKNTSNIENVPDIRMRPFVYDYAHTIMLDNFRARTYTGEIDKMLYDGVPGDCVLSTLTFARSYGGNSIPENNNTRMQVVDGFVDYIGQLGEYLSVKFEELGIPATLNETNVIDYQNVLDGTNFDLFITPTGGYTEVYNQLKRAFTRHAQVAVDYNATTIDEELHKLFWLQELSSASTKLWYMSMLLYYDRTGSYGLYTNDIIEEYGTRGNNGTCEMYRFVEFDAGFGRELIELPYVYNRYMQNYLKHFAA